MKEMRLSKRPVGPIALFMQAIWTVPKVAFFPTLNMLLFKEYFNVSEYDPLLI
jgi:hypothetical protein